MENSQTTSTQNISWLKHPAKLFEKVKTEKRSELQNPATNTKNCMPDEVTNSQNKEEENPQTCKPPGKNPRKMENTENVQTLNQQLRCLNILEESIVKFKHDEGLVNLFSAFFKAMDNNKNLQLKKMELFGSFLENIEDMNKKELEDMLITLKNVFSYKLYNHLLITDDNLDVQNLLALGEFSTVVFGIFTKNDVISNVALKIGKSKKLIENEANMLAQLDHKHIVKILGVHKTEPIIVLEFMKYGPITEALNKLNFTNLSLMTILEHTASAMEYLHGKDILHRNLCCSHIFINSKKQCKLGDFAISVFVGESNGTYHERECNKIPLYITAPEAKNSQNFTKQTDIWAMGILIPELFLLAVKCGDPFNVRYLFLNTSHWDRLPFPKKCPIAVHEYAVKKILVKDPRQRPSFPQIKEKIHYFIQKKAYTVCVP